MPFHYCNHGNSINTTPPQSQSADQLKPNSIYYVFNSQIPYNLTFILKIRCHSSLRPRLQNANTSLRTNQ